MLYCKRYVCTPCRTNSRLVYLCVLLLCTFLAAVHQLSSCRAGTAASEQEKALQQSLLKRVLQEAAPEAPPQLLVDAAAVLISAATPSHSPASTTQSGWMQDGDDDLQQQLAELARGIDCGPPLQSLDPCVFQRIICPGVLYILQDCNTGLWPPHIYALRLQE